MAFCRLTLVGLKLMDAFKKVPVKDVAKRYMEWSMTWEELGRRDQNGGLVPIWLDELLSSPNVLSRGIPPITRTNHGKGKYNMRTVQRSPGPCLFTTGYYPVSIRKDMICGGGLVYDSKRAAYSHCEPLPRQPILAMPYARCQMNGLMRELPVS